MSKSRSPKARVPVRPRAYELTNTPLPFARGTYYRWEKAKIIPPLLRLGGKTLLQDETVEAIISGEIVLPQNAGRIKAPKPIDRGGHAKRRKANAKREQSIRAAE